MANFEFKYQNLEISDKAIEELNAELEVDIIEFGLEDWGDFENGVLTKSENDEGFDYDFSFPNSNDEFLQRGRFIALLASKITAGSALVSFTGSTPNDGGEVYQIIADSEVTVKKYDIKPVHDTNYSLIKPLYSETAEPTEPITYGSTLNAGDAKADEVELLGAGTIRFNALSAGDLDDVSVLANTKTANIVIDGTPISQLKFNSAYIGETAEFDHDSKTYTITIAEATITATLKA